VVGSIMGVVIGSNELLRSLFMKSGGLFLPLFGAAKSMGVAYLPAAVLVLAGSLFGAKSSSGNESSSKSNINKIHPKTIMSILLSRFVLSPVLALMTVRILSITKLLPMDSPRTLAIVMFVLLMEGCMPVSTSHSNMKKNDIIRILLVNLSFVLELMSLIHISLLLLNL